jgi:effector-binding domain-containing protein
MRYLFLSSLLVFTMSTAHAYTQAFPRTEPGEIEVKVLPEGRLLECVGEGDYFNQANSLFGPLFRYIKEHDISMTTPVEARIDPGAMYFWVSDEQAAKATEGNDQVRVIDVEERMVAAIGMRGGYSQANFEKGWKALQNWIKNENDLKIIGEPYAIYWNGPFVPGLLKKSEVQVKVRRMHWE